MKKIAINGLGRIGKLLLRRLFDVGLGEHVVLINDLNSDSKIHAHLLEFDTVHGRWKNKIESSRGKIRIVGRERYPTRSFSTTSAYTAVKYLPETTR